MKKVVTILLLVCLVGACVPAWAEPSAQEAFQLVGEIYQKHTQQHHFSVLYTDESQRTGLMYADDGGMDALLACLEYVLPETRSVPSYAGAINELFLELLVAAQSASATMDVPTFDMARFEDDYSGNVQLKVLGNDWWKKYTQDGITMLLGPLLLTDARGNVADDTIHVLCMFFSEGSTRLWLFHDADLVTELYARMNLSIGDSGANARFIKTWLADMEAYLAGQTQEKGIDDMLPATPGQENETAAIPPRGPEAAAAAEAERQAWLDSLVVIGTAKMTNREQVNLRDERGTDGSIKGKAQPGETFDVVGVNEANGWYEVIVGRDTAFISPKLVEFTPTAEYLREQEAQAALNATP